MSDQEHNGWEPDPRKMGNWRAMFEQPRQGGQPCGATPIAADPAASPEPLDDGAMAHDPAVYRPWTLQRGGSRPSMMLDFRRYEPRSGFWSGWAICYPYLVGMEYTGDRMLSLDFGRSQVMILGSGLEELIRHTQQGHVVAIHEFAASLWPSVTHGPIIDTIRQISKDPG